MALYIIGIVLCVIGGGMLGWGIPQKDTTMMIVGGCIAGFGLIVTTIGSLIGKKNVKPNRTTFDIDYSGDDAEEKIKKLLNYYGFIPVQYGSESVYRLGTGFWTARKFVRYTILENKIIIVAWVSIGMGNRPNVEMQLDDKFVCCLPKNKLKSVVLDIINKLKYESNSPKQEEIVVVEEKPE